MELSAFGSAARIKVQWLPASVASLLIVLLVFPASAFADATPLDTAAVHQRIVERGVGHSVNIEERTGVVLSGKIEAIGANSFTLRLRDNPNPVNVKYLDVADFPRGGPHGSTIFLLTGIGAAAAFSIWAVVHFHNVEQQNQLPTTPPVPTIP